MNKVTTVFKDAVRIAYESIGGHEAFSEWARQNPTEFYRIAARLIPTEITHSGEGVRVYVQRSEQPKVVDGTGWVEIAQIGRTLT